MEVQTILKLNKVELSELLNIKESGLKSIIRRKQLSEKLTNIGYNLVEIIKEDNKNIYIIEQTNINKQVYNNICKYVYKTNNDEAFSKYFLARTDDNNYNLNNKIYSKKDIGNIAD